MASLPVLCIVTFFGQARSQGWECPSDWAGNGHDDNPGKVKDAKQFVAAVNVFRCMHGVPAVQWDHDVYSSAKRWALRTGESMTHSPIGVYRRSDTGESLAGTTLSSKRPGVDAAQMWYSEILEMCHGRPDCFQSTNASNFAALVWRDVRKIAYANPTGRLAIGRYQAKEDGLAPNTPNEYRLEVPLVIKGYGHCSESVVACPAFRGIDPSDLDACDVAAEARELHGTWVGMTVYRTRCTDKYRSLARLYEIHTDAFGSGVLAGVAPQSLFWAFAAIAAMVSISAMSIIFRACPQSNKESCRQCTAAAVRYEYVAASTSSPAECLRLDSHEGLSGIDAIHDDHASDGFA